MVGEDSWWFYFERPPYAPNNTTAKCKHCDWSADQGPNRRTTLLERHLKSKHRELFDKRQGALAIATVAKVNAKKKDGKVRRQTKIPFRPVKQQLADESALFGDKNDYQPKKTKAKMSTIHQALKTWGVNGTKTEEIEQSIMEMVCVDALPLMTVENEGFKRMMSIAVPSFQLKSQHYYTENILPKIYTKMIGRMKRDLKTVDYISITTNLWSAKDNAHCLLALTAHFLTEEFVPAFLVLGAVPVKEKHKSERVITDYINSRMEEMDLPLSKIHLILRDAGLNVVDACNNIMEIQSFDCFLHKLDLAINDGFAAINFNEHEVIEKMKTIMRKVRKSSVQRHLFVELQRGLDFPLKLLQKHCKVHWTSMSSMLDRFIKNRDAVQAFSISLEARKCNKDKDLPQLNAVEWDQIKQIADVLKIIRQASISLQSRMATIATVLPFYFSIRKKLSSGEIIWPYGSENFRAAICSKLDLLMYRWDENKCLVIATVLDPRFKMELFTHQEKIKQWIEFELKSIYHPNLDRYNNGQSNVHMSMSTGTNDFLHDLFECSDGPTSSRWIGQENAVLDAQNDIIMSLQQLEKFLCSPRVAPNTEPSVWWKNNAVEYKFLLPLIKKYHSAPPGSVESERLFSSARFILNDLRTSLAPESLEKLLFLHHNIPLYNFNY